VRNSCVEDREGKWFNNNSLLAQLTPNIGSKATKKWIKHIHQQQLSCTNKQKAVSQYNKCNQVPPVLSSKDRLIKDPKDFTCCEDAIAIAH
jgi:hypothetical protein